MQILATKLYIPPPRTRGVYRPRLSEQLDAGLPRQLTLLSAPAGFGKTTLVSDWLAGRQRPVAWLSLDEGDSDLARFIIYLVTALQTITKKFGASTLALVHAAEPPSTEALLTNLVNEITTIPNDFILVLDDYHALDSKAVDEALAFLLDHQPPHMHLVIATRQDPGLPLARLRARGQLTELRAADLRFTPAEAAEFLNRVMGLKLSADDVAALDTRTEGWIAGLQLAALSMQGHSDAAHFIQSFTGSHHFVLDYLIQEVLQRQPASTQDFLLRTSILDRMCGALCDAVLGKDESRKMKDESLSSSFTRSGHPASFILESLERANLFIIPLDNERRWYRYHHLFGDLLRQRLQQSSFDVAELHTRASEWYEHNDLMLEAFRHATAAQDVARAVRLMESKQMPFHLPGVATAVLNWLESLPETVLNAQPNLWWEQATLLLGMSQISSVEEKLQAAEAALARIAPDNLLDDKHRDLIGKIAVVRASVALAQHQIENIFAQARRALEYLNPDDLAGRSEAIQTMGYAFYLQGDRVAAGNAYTQALSLARASGNKINTVLATTSLAQIQHLENQLHLAADAYRSVLQMVSDYSPSNVGVVYFGLARICYEWNDLESAEQYGEECLRLAQLHNQFINRFITGAIFLARLKLVRGDADGAAKLLAQAEQSAREHNFMHQMPAVVAAQVLLLLCQNNLAAAAELTRQHDIPMSHARVLLAQGNPSAALETLELYLHQVEAKKWQDERLRVMVLQSVAHFAHGEKEKSAQLLGDVLMLAEPGGFIRTFVDEGETMRLMIADCRLQIENKTVAEYADRILAAFPVGKLETRNSKSEIRNLKSEIPFEPLSARELQVLQLIAQGLSNREIGERLFLALSTVKGHSRIIFDKLQVRNRTEAVARARELGLL